MRGARPVDSNRPNGYDKPVKTAHLGLDCLSVIKIETGTFESTNSLTIDNNSIRYSNITVYSLRTKFSHEKIHKINYCTRMRHTGPSLLRSERAIPAYRRTAIPYGQKPGYDTCSANGPMIHNHKSPAPAGPREAPALVP